MAYRYGERQQHMLFPQRIEDYIAEDDPVRDDRNASEQQHYQEPGQVDQSGHGA